MRLLRSFRCAFQGAAHHLRTEPNAKIQIVLGIFAVMLGAWLRISVLEWIAVVLAISLVLSMEAMNTAVELLCNRVTGERDPQIGIVKDVSAGAVLFAATGASLTGLIVFGPKLIRVVTGTVVV